MGKIMILNGSPRASQSNSRRYAELFMKFCSSETAYFNITKNNHEELCAKMEAYSDVLFIFPLYADALPVTLLNFLKSLEVASLKKKPVISIFINCGFLEYQQNEIAVEMMRYFCRQNQYRTGSVLMLGSGEAILKTPFRFVAQRAIKKLAKSMAEEHYLEIHATMPLSKRMFLIASTYYWILYGKKFGTSKSAMGTMKIE